jgi:hypothetical protein
LLVLYTPRRTVAALLSSFFLSLFHNNNAAQKFVPTRETFESVRERPLKAFARDPGFRATTHGYRAGIKRGFFYDTTPGRARVPGDLALRRARRSPALSPLPLWIQSGIQFDLTSSSSSSRRKRRRKRRRGPGRLCGSGK